MIVNTTIGWLSNLIYFNQLINNRLGSAVARSLWIYICDSPKFLMVFVKNNWSTGL